jgi:DNA processing protein
MFPARNRIISGLSRAVIVVEANAKSGALITARHAAEQGREVYAVPGRVDDPTSAGCLELLRGGARLVRGADDVIEDLRGIAPLGQGTGGRRQETESRKQESKDSKSVSSLPPVPCPLPPEPSLSEPERRVYDALAARRHADELARELGLPVADLSRLLMQLELKRVVRRQPGNYYERR